LIVYYILLIYTNDIKLLKKVNKIIVLVISNIINVWQGAECMKMWITCSSDVFFHGKIWSLISDWLGFVTVSPSYLSDQLLHFTTLGGFSNQIGMNLTIISLSIVWII